ncbi:MliC family protein [Larkinella rosea]|uniref:C-type lysozyme inhibitor domain-containing protein n=1 Tax=Larkinella rosea TaxID=2025312 RepID=A0A3P1BND2_9BACT|nr:MliC family protein [Larkinella rosea]RRB02650.1 hypothetical protein EHT25_19585 [Larkinella rosea]
MKTVLFTTGLLISMVASSCQKKEKTSEQTTSSAVTTAPQADEIIRDTVTNQNGVQLVMAFNNTKQTATLVWQGETLELKQDRMASGIKYRNPAYELTEHQGELTLKKDGKVVFSHYK